MHPDDIITGLRRELECYPERAKEIKAEIARVDACARPAVRAEDATLALVADPQRAYLAGLKRELERVGEEGAEQVKIEIERVEALLRRDKPSAAEIEQRKQARTGQKVERAINEPGGRQAPANAPGEGEKE